MQQLPSHYLEVRSGRILKTVTSKFISRFISSRGVHFHCYLPYSALHTPATSFYELEETMNSFSHNNFCTSETEHENGMNIA